MVTITFRKPNETDTREFKIPAHSADERIAMFRHAGYEILGDSRTAAEVTVSAAPVVTTGRVPGGKVVHKILAGSTACGASFRRNRIGNPVQPTGEAVTCRNHACR